MSQEVVPSYRIGQLVWCRWGTIWWPSMISYDPHSATYFKKTNTAITSYHVQYFGIVPQRGWVNCRLLVPMESITEKERAIVKGKKKKDYEVAMEEAKEAIGLNLKQRKLKFIFNFDDGLRRKRKQSSSTTSVAKKDKTTPTTTVEPLPWKPTHSLPTLPDELLPIAKTKIIDPLKTPLILLIGDTPTTETTPSAPPTILDSRIRTEGEEPIVSLPSNQLVDSQGGDSGFETGSDFSTTPALQATPTTNDQSDPFEFLESPDANQPIPAKKPKSLKTTPAIATPTSSNHMTCAICDSDNGDLITCKGSCLQAFHLDCLGIVKVPKAGICCDDCLTTPTVCHQCRGQGGEPLVSCDHNECDKHYHLSCVRSMDTFMLTEDTISSCGLHSCAKCTSTPNPSTTSLIQCVKCPIALHKATCLVAGCEVLNDSQMICYTHLDLSSKSLPTHFNMNTCLDCGDGGTLVCCDFCSAAYHNHCLPEDHRASDSAHKWVCPFCQSHDLPTYESVVICKCGTHRWWPAQVIPNRRVPNALRPSKPAPCTFLVKFFGTEQYFWTHHGRVLAFNEDCVPTELANGKKRLQTITKNTKQDQIKAQYTQALAEAMDYCRERWTKMEGLKQHKIESKNFIHMKRNKYLVPTPINDPITDPCKCTLNAPCTPDSNCINRAIYTECSSGLCPMGMKCENRKIMKSQNAPAEIFYTGGRGWGLKASERIPCGEFVIEYIGEVLNMEMVRERLKRGEERDVSNFYFLTMGHNLVIDASNKSNNARFINHSCDPNCQTQKWKVNGETRIAIIAIKDIPVGTELTFDYMLDSLGNGKKRCLCGAKNCSGFLGLKPSKTTQVNDTETRKRKSSAVIFKNKLCKADPYDEECFVCRGEGNRLLLCDHPNCCRVYHTKCVHLKKIPRGDFICPRHYCLTCSLPTTAMCSQCPSAYCDTHKDKLIETHNDEYLCTNCTPSSS